MEENKAMAPANGLKKEFVDEYKTSVGKTVATSLAGFLAGAVVVGIILYPWLYFLGKLCPPGK